MKRNAGLALVAVLGLGACSGSEPVEDAAAPLVPSGPWFEESLAWEDIDRSQLGSNELRLLEFFETVVHGQDAAALNDYVAEDYLAQIPGVGSGREGLREYLQNEVWPIEERRSYLVSHIISSGEGELVALHQTVRTTDEAGAVTDVRQITDIARFDGEGRIAEHWNVVGGAQDENFDAWALSEENASSWVNREAPIEFTGMWRFRIDSARGLGPAEEIKAQMRELPYNEAGRQRFESYDATDPGQNPIMECVTLAMPSFMSQTGALAQITQLEDRVLFRSQDFPEVTRVIWTDGRRHPENLEPAPLGHSIGRFEGNVLVVDTVAASTGSGYDITREGAPSSGQITITERFRIDPTDNTLIVEIRVDDPVYYTEPFTLVRTFPWIGEAEFIPAGCVARPYLPPESD